MRTEPNNVIANEQLMQRLKQSLKVIDQLEHRLKKEIDARHEPIAIVGMGCRFPGGVQSPEQFWELLANGTDAIGEVPAGRWDIEQYFDADSDAPGKINSRFGGFLSEADQFDAGFFEISPREAASMDPQQRLLLEVVWEALENADVVPASLYGGNTGVFTAISGSDYMLAQAKYVGENDITAYFGTGNAHASACGRLSYTLGCQGPSFSVDTACSSSLVALHTACMSLRAGDCDGAVVASSNLMLTPDISITFSRAHMLAPDGRCKTFDAAADGYVRGEGVAAVYVKRLSDALRDGNPVRAVILGSAVNQDGASAGLTVPNGVAQQAVIRQALKNARVSADQVDYVEAHGTGTSLGDPIEIGALGAVYGDARPQGKPLLVGSVKTNIGHTEAAAGMAGLIKLVLSLEHGEIPRHLNFTNPSPLIPWQDVNIAVADSHQPWSKASPERMAGLSAFGFGGTNGHIIVAASPAVAKEPGAESSVCERTAHILKLSARSPGALAELARRYIGALERDAGMNLADFACTANTSRSDFLFRHAAVAADRQDMMRTLENFAAQDSGHIGHGIEQKPCLAFLFAGQGSQYAGMGQALYLGYPAFRAVIDECEERLRAHWDRPLREILWGGDASLLDETRYTQPALFALELALARLWESWGIVPAAVLGHSVGEYAAACFAGVFSLADGLRLIEARGRLMAERCERGAMAAVFAPLDTVAPWLEGYAGQLAVAAVNGPHNTVVSGSREALAAFTVELDRQSVGYQGLSVSHAFHSPMMAPMLEAFAEVAESVTYQRPRLGVISNLTGQAETDRLAQASYWVEHVSAPVQFAQGFETLAQQGVDALLEVGPGSTLLGMGRRVLEGRDTMPGTWLASLNRGQADERVVLQSLARLYEGGATVDWKAFDAPYARGRVPVPTYPFQRKRYWYNDKSSISAAGSGPSAPELSAFEAAWLSALRRGNPESLDACLPGQALPADSRRVLTDILRQLQSFSGHDSDSLLARMGVKMHWEAVSLPAAEPVLSGGTLLVADDAGQVRQLCDALARAGTEVTLVLPGQWDDLTAERSVHDFDRLIFCRTAGENDRNPELPAHALLRSVQAGSAGSEIWAITRGAVICEEKDQEFSAAQACVWGVCNALAAEMPEQFKAVLDLPLRASDPDGAVSGEEAAQVAALIAELRDADQAAIRGEVFYVPYLQPWTFDQRPAKAAFADDAAYLVTGAFGGLGLALSDWLVAQGVRHLVLVSRSGARSAEAQAALARWAAQQVNVKVLNVDVADREALLSSYEPLRAELPPLKGVFHLAGVIGELTDSAELSLESLAQVLAPKVAGTLNLDALSRNESLDYFVNFSSISSVWGSAQQAAYTAANQFLDSFAACRMRHRRPVQSINWGPWAEAGMGVKLGREHDMARIGIRGLSNADALRVLGEVLALGPATQVVAADVDWNKFAPLYAANRHNRLFRRMQANDGHAQASAPDANALRQKMAALPKRKWQEQLTAALRRHVTEICQLDAGQSLSPHQGFTELGMDSLMAVELKERLQRDFGIKLGAAIVFDYPTIDSLAKHVGGLLEADLRQTENAPDATPPAAAEDCAAGLENAVVDFEDLSEEQAEAMLLAKLQTL